MKSLLLLALVLDLGFAVQTTDSYELDSLLAALEGATESSRIGGAQTDYEEACYMRVNVESCSYTIWLQMFLLPGEPSSRYVNPSSEEQAVCLSVPCADNRLRVMAVLTADGGPADAHPDSFDAGYEVYGDVEACIAGEKGHSAVVYCEKLQRSQSSNSQSLGKWNPAPMHVQETGEYPTSDSMVNIQDADDIPVGNFGEGYVVELWYLAPRTGRAAINLYGENSDIIVLHANPRYDTNVVVFNSHLGGRWGSEERPGGFPLNPGVYTSLKVVAGHDGYDVYANGNEFHYHYNHRTPVSHVKRVAWYSESNEGSIAIGKMLKGYGPYRVVYIHGRAPDSGRFSINFVTGDDIAFHFNPRFDQNEVVRNTYSNGAWGYPEERHGGFPFQEGEEFEVVIVCKQDKYEVSVGGQYFISYNHRIPYTSDMTVRLDNVPEIKKLLYI